jgi:hypothetical protein
LQAWGSRFPKAGFSKLWLTLSQTEVTPGGGCDGTHMVPFIAFFLSFSNVSTVLAE